MAEQNEIRVRISFPTECVAALQRFAAADPIGVTVESVRKGSPPAFRGLGLSTVADVVTVVQGAVLVGQFALFLYNLLQERRLKKVVIQATRGRVTLAYSAALTLDDVVKQLKSLMVTPPNA